MLMKRVVTAVALLGPALAAIFLLPPAGLAVVLVLISGLAADEWAGLSELAPGAARKGYAAVVFSLAASVAALFLWVPQLAIARGLMMVASLGWGLALVVIAKLAHVPELPKLGQKSRLILGAVLIPAAIVGLLMARASAWGPPGLLTVFAIVWAADIGAYFAGRSFGRHKLAPSVSPGKTWEGFAGGLLASLLVGWLAATYWLVPAPQAMGLWLAWVAVVMALSVIGDLVESLLKRVAGVKDSGTLLPGHGGVLDRIDSVLAAAPLMALSLDWFL